MSRNSCPVFLVLICTRPLLKISVEEELNVQGLLPDIAAVSYTHLDVYKRQVYTFYREPFQE